MDLWWQTDKKQGENLRLVVGDHVMKKSCESTRLRVFGMKEGLDVLEHLHLSDSMLQSQEPEIVRKRTFVCQLRFVHGAVDIV